MKKKLTEDKIVDIVVYILLTIVGIITVYPFYYTIICSLKAVFIYFQENLHWQIISCF